MSRYDYDLFVIGGGSGGVRASRMAAGLGLRVGLAEEWRMGGTCVIRGCIPKKLLVYAGHFADDFEDAAGYGWTVGQASFDWPALIRNKDKEIARLEALYLKNVQASGVDVFADRAEFEDAHTLRLTKSGKRVTADKILVATGGRPSRDLGGARGSELCITSNEAFDLRELPRRVLIAGGSYIALEFAHIFHNLGCEVCLVYRGEKILRGFDEDLRDALIESMGKRGMRVLLNERFTRIEKRGNVLHAEGTRGDVIEADQILLAIGRIPNTDGMGLQQIGVRLGKRDKIEVDEYSRTSVENIYAIGDVTDRLQLTPVAIHEAMCFVKTAFEGKPTRPDHERVPTAVFSTPEIGTVGLSEKAALERGFSVHVFRSKFRPLLHTLSGRDERMMMKLVVDQNSDRVLGCHIFGDGAAEIIQAVAIAVKMGATKAQFDATIALHPSAAEELVTMREASYSRLP